MILGRREVLPASCQKISVRPDTEICSMNVRMRSIRMDQVGISEAFGDKRAMFFERVYIDNSCDCGEPGLRHS
jgi:hypothetical protein